MLELQLAERDVFVARSKDRARLLSLTEKPPLDPLMKTLCLFADFQKIFFETHSMPG